jgi:uroporphyrinogen-III synthase
MPLRVCSLESRRADEMRSLIERHGGNAFVAPSLREIPIEQNQPVFDFLVQLADKRVDVVIFLTGVGARAMLDVVETKMPREQFFAELSRCTIVVRGPKPVAVLREWGVRIDHRVPEPNTWHELLDLLDVEAPVTGKTVAVQEYGKPNPELYESLKDRGAVVLPVPVYRWALPNDIEPLRLAVQKLIACDFDVLLITSAQQIHHLLAVAEQMGLRDACLAAVKCCRIGSIGPTATEALQALGLGVDIEASHPKMGLLVKESLETFSSQMAVTDGTRTGGASNRSSATDAT